jgi:hypothetical protein
MAIWALQYLLNFSKTIIVKLIKRWVAIFPTSFLYPLADFCITVINKADLYILVQFCEKRYRDQDRHPNSKKTAVSLGWIPPAPQMNCKKKRPHRDRFLNFIVLSVTEEQL